MVKPKFAVIDGSNLATEGRTLPSLAQLDEAVAALAEERPELEIIVVVDASFEHRIEAPERPAFDQAELNGRIVSPPAGAIGRGDAFVLRIAQRADAVVVSNDSFQEFHGEHPWLFENGRLIGGKPVPGVGWIFTPRSPVRGAKSRRASENAVAVKAIKPTKRAKAKPTEAKPTEAKPTEAPVEVAPPPAPKKAAAKRAAATGTAKAPPAKASHLVAPVTGSVRQLRQAIAVATAEAIDPDQLAVKNKEKAPKKKRRHTSPPGAANTPLNFIQFAARHSLGDSLSGEVTSFTSHGVMVGIEEGDLGVLQCYVPLSGLGDPAPVKARGIVAIGDRREFILVSLDPPRRAIELRLDLAPKPTRPRRRKAPTKATATNDAPAKSVSPKATAPKTPTPKKAAKPAE